MNQKIVTWLRSLAKEEKEIATIKIEIGERGNSTQVAILTYEDNPEELSREMQFILASPIALLKPE